MLLASEFTKSGQVVGASCFTFGKVLSDEVGASFPPGKLGSGCGAIASDRGAYEQRTTSDEPHFSPTHVYVCSCLAATPSIPVALTAHRNHDVYHQHTRSRTGRAAGCRWFYMFFVNLCSIRAYTPWQLVRPLGSYTGQRGGGEAGQNKFHVCRPAISRCFVRLVCWRALWT